jgi:PAS domain S-box-containing protein
MSGDDEGNRENKKISHLNFDHASTEDKSIAYDSINGDWLDEAATSSDGKYRLLFENANEAIMVIQDAKIKFFNPQVIKFSGYRESELMLRPFVDLIYPDDKKMVVMNYRHRLQGKCLPQSYTFRAIHKDGTVKWIEISAVLIAWEDKPATLNFLTDVTKRIEAEEELHKKDVLLGAVAVATNILITEWSLNRAINQVLEILGGATKVDRIAIFENRNSDEGEHFMSLRYSWSRDNEFSLKDDPDFQDAPYDPEFSRFYNVLSSGRPIKCSLLEYTKTERALIESKKVKSLIVFPIIIHGQFWGFMAFDDIHSERDWTSVEVSILMATAASIGGTIARKYTENELREAKKIAESAARAKSDFLANMSHEIRTPLNAVIGLTDLTLKTDITQEQRSYLEIIRSSGDSLLSVINKILDFTKIDREKVELESKPFELRRCVEDSLNLVRTIASEKSLDLTYEISASVPQAIMGDPVRIQQILVNLLSNAVKFTEKGFILVSVHSMKFDDTCHEIHFKVRDTGVGIPEDKIDGLFQPFTQVDASTTRKYGGTGLGLAISKRLVGLMRGKIWAESQLGIGSTFHFTLVAKAANLDDIENERVDEPEGVKLGKPGFRILLAEDNVINQMVMVKMLNKLGYQADVVANGKEVLSSLEHHNYDLILMDVQMPEMDGFETTRAIRKLRPSGNHPKIIAITAYALKEDRQRCLDAGMDDYISKPVRLQDLAEMLEKIS